LLCTLVIPTLILGIYTAPILDGLNYGVSSLIFNNVDIFYDYLVSIPIIGKLNPAFYKGCVHRVMHFDCRS